MALTRIKTVMVALALVVKVAGAVQLPQQSGISVVRAYRPVDGQTAVDLFCREPLRLGHSRGSLELAVSVRDSSGLEVVARSWRSSETSRAEHLAFVVRPGPYAVMVTVTDTASGRITSETVSVRAFSHAPGASDLLLATALRAAATPSDTVAQPGELRRGSVFLLTTGEPVLTPSESTLAYYLELYSDKPESVLVSSRVLTLTGTQVRFTAPAAKGIDAGGDSIDGLVDVGGLPPGRYRFELMATGPDSLLSRSAPFAITGPAAPSGDWPASLGEALLDEAYQPLIYLMSAGEQGVYSSLSVEGKRKWLRRFWARRDPTPGTAPNEERDRFYAAVGDADRRYGEGGAAAIPGWRTDRGRVFIKYGVPTETIARHAPSGTALPYEIWSYSRGSLKYVFVDLTRFGNYSLIYTNDERERSWPNWQDLLGPEGIRDLEQND